MNPGATAIEYGLIASLIAVAIITILGTLGTNLSTTFVEGFGGQGLVNPPRQKTRLQEPDFRAADFLRGLRPFSHSDLFPARTSP